MSLTYKELIAQREALEQQILEARKTETGDAISRIRELVEQYGLTSDDIFAPRRKASALKGAPVAPKFRDPATGATWTGRGKAPLWLRDVEDRSTFAV